MPVLIRQRGGTLGWAWGKDTCLQNSSGETSWKNPLIFENL